MSELDDIKAAAIKRGEEGLASIASHIRDDEYDPDPDNPKLGTGTLLTGAGLRVLLMLKQEGKPLPPTWEKDVDYYLHLKKRTIAWWKAELQRVEEDFMWGCKARRLLHG